MTPSDAPLMAVVTEPGQGADRRSVGAWVAGQLGSATEARWMLDAVLGPAPIGGSDQVPMGGSDQLQTLGAGRQGVPVDDASRAELRSLVDRRRGGEPLQYVLGRWAFRHLDLLVDPRVLIPRPETEQVVEVALAELEILAEGRTAPVVVDLGTGSGAIALSLATEVPRGRPGLEVWACDVDPGALEVARANLADVSVTEPSVMGRVHLCQGSWWGALPDDLFGRVDLVVSNPPYVAEHEWPDLDPAVRMEPKGALVAGPASEGTPGLGDVEAVLVGATAWLGRPGSAVIEIAPAQAEASVQIATRLGFTHAVVHPDLTGRPRTLVARR